MKGKNLSLDDLKEAMRNQYRIVQGRNDEDEDENEMGLTSHHYKGKKSQKERLEVNVTIVERSDTKSQIVLS